MPQVDAGQPLSRAARLAATALAKRWRLPRALGPARVLRDVAVPMRDGASLRADVHLPPTVGPHPTVLLRSPYGRGPQFAVTMAVPYAERGYAVVLQSVRGTFGSGGDFAPVVNEEHDGQDTVAWLRDQPWFDGRLATLGPSYLGYTQWALALDPPPELKAMVLHIGPHDLAQAGLVDGAFQLTNLAIWTELVAHQERFGAIRGTARLMTAERRLAPHLHRLPLQGLAERFGGNPAPWFDEWLAHPDLADPYWDRYRATPAVHSSTVPTLLVGGWQDWFLEQTLHQYAVLRDRGVDVGLTVGPWAHLTIDAAVTTPESLAWLNTHLPVEGTQPIRRPDRVRVHVTGVRTWRGMDDWPPPTTDRTWYLAGSGALRDDPPAEPDATSFRHDPVDPTPSVGGRVLARSAGRRDNRRLEARDDVRTFTTAPLTQPVELLGGATVRLCLTSDNPYADVFVRLCDVDPRGRSVNVTDRLVRLDPAEGEEPVVGERLVETTLPDTAHRFLAGHRLRLQVSGGAHPRYARNLGTGEPPGQGTHGVPVTHRIGHGGASASSVTLPLG
ncbi:CocE/NonD family hydrolase [Blastococcus sp. MG754426]|uniref:CocE/NonD family hydrolase n=1 Tax=unclassified Blastococcus TaxID=2619396 RepID=UPI001EF081D9|nr:MULTISPECIES: CocE/NonD family hydrolase [unclassified Blastococcus]MCF6508729.1 CocE/NonD family hydrolase [Blastococcus sp. MG754426]MCF6513338.1 CocE/NonD family hydrolase [Blastococcus sp. MG754427]